MEAEFNKLIEKIEKYNKQTDKDLLKRAFDEAKSAHTDQHRQSGEPYFLHPLEVANILAELEMDNETIAAGLLHDIIEDTPHSFEEIKQKFGEQVALLVEGVTKLEKISYTNKEQLQVENLRKMFLAMADDIRVIIIKLADRLHNMRTIKWMCEEKQRAKAKETLEVYAPLAHRLGMSKIKWELEDWSLRYLDPIAYNEIMVSIKQKRVERENYIKALLDTLEDKLSQLGVHYHIEGRAKHFYSIYKKMFTQEKNIDEIYDLFAIRIIVDSISECYAVLGMVHELYKPLPGRFKDYIAMPKPNMYQSLHTTVIGPKGTPFEIQIRTWEMHRIAEFGIAAHWKYKEGKAGENKIDSKLAWVRQILDVQNDVSDAEEFMQTLKIDFFADEVFVFTPKGDVMNLPAGSCPIDFAYAIHSAVGNRMIGAKVSGKIVPIEYKLQNGDIVEIITSAADHGPSRDWLKIVKTSQARNKINQWFKMDKREENIAKGKEIIDREVKKAEILDPQNFKEEFVETIYKKYSFKTLDDLYSSLGYGGVQASRIISRLKDEIKRVSESNQEKKDDNDIITASPDQAYRKASSGIVVKGIENCLVRISKCCNPVPGDEIVGYITRGRGVSIHSRDCVNVMGFGQEDKNRLIDVAWEGSTTGNYNADLEIIANDRTGLLMEVSSLLTELKVPVSAINGRITKNKKVILDMTIEINSTKMLEFVVKKLTKIKDILEVRRTKH